MFKRDEVNLAGMMSKWCQIIEDVLSQLTNKGWVETEEAIGQTGLAKVDALRILDFLSESGLIKFNASKEKIRITDLASKLMNLPDS